MEPTIDPFTASERRPLVLESGKERVVRNRHPWIFAGAIGRESGPEDAALADLIDPSGTRVASGFHSRFSQIRLRALTFGDEELTAEVLRTRIVRAIAARRRLFDEATNAARLIHAEGDDLSGLVVDRYDDVLVVEIVNRGIGQLQSLVVETLRRELEPRVIYFKNDLAVRKLEQLPAEPQSIGEGEPSTTIRELGLRFHVDPAAGQKTGFFLDQRENRDLARGYAAGCRVLNLFAYSAGWGVYAAGGGAKEVENVDIGARAMELARTNHDLNNLGGNAGFTGADVFQYVGEKVAEEARFDFVVCAPPAFAKSRGD